MGSGTLYTLRLLKPRLFVNYPLSSRWERGLDPLPSPFRDVVRCSSLLERTLTRVQVWGDVLLELSDRVRNAQLGGFRAPYYRFTLNEISIRSPKTESQKRESNKRFLTFD